MTFRPPDRHADKPPPATPASGSATDNDVSHVIRSSEGFNPEQPRAPAGGSDGGQWSAGGGGGGGTGGGGGGGKGGASGTHAAGITSARGDKPRQQVFAEMSGFKTQLAGLPGVTDVHVTPAVGQTAAWGWEPSWNVVYTGNGAARALVAQTAKAQDQDAAFLVSGGCKGESCSPVVEYKFDGPMPGAGRAVIDKALAEEGFGGWTWAKNSGGQAFLRAVYVKEWAGAQSRMDFVRASHAAFVSLKLSGVHSTVSRKNATVEVLARENNYGL